jgi:hypothetical protein
MTEQQIEIDAMLATAVSRLMSAGAVVNLMRELNRQEQPLAYWRAAVDLGEHLTVAGHTLTEAHRMLMARQGIAVQTDGGLIN